MIALEIHGSAEGAAGLTANRAWAAESVGCAKDLRDADGVPRAGAVLLPWSRSAWGSENRERSS